MTQPTCVPCHGVWALTPLPIYNRPGLDRLSYRVGSHASCLETMLANLSSVGIPVRFDPDTGKPVPPLLQPLLKKLTSRDPADPSIAWLDAWALIADVLSFYQERYANEGYLRTAVERLSVHHLSRLVGYTPRPGLSSSVYLAFEVESPTAVPFALPGQASSPAPADVEVTIPKGTQAKSTPIPGSGDLPQTFETSEELVAKPEWNAIKPRLTRPQRITFSRINDLSRLFFQGTGHGLAVNDFLAISTDPQRRPTIRQIASVEEHPERQITIAFLRGDALSPTLLLQELRADVNTFLTDLESSRLVTPKVIDDVRTILLGKLDEAEKGAEGLGLTGIDKMFQDFACGSELAAQPQIQQGTIRGKLQSLSEWAKALEKFLAPEGKVLPLKAVRQAYNDAHGNAVAQYKGRVALASDVSKTAGNGEDPVAPVVARLKRFLWDPRLVDSLTNEPILFLGPMAPRTMTTGPQKIAEKVVVLDRPSSTLPTVKLRAEVLVGGAEPPEFTLIDSHNREHIQKAINNLQVTLANNTRAWVRVGVLEEPAPGRLLATCIQQVATGNPPPLEFPSFANEKTILREPANAPTLVDSTLTLHSDEQKDASKYWALLTVLHGTGNLDGSGASPDKYTWVQVVSTKVASTKNWILSPRLGATVTIANFENALKAVKYTLGTSDELRVVVQIILHKSDLPIDSSVLPDTSTAVAAGIRELIAHSSDKRALRARLGALHGELSDPSLATDEVQKKLETFKKDVGDPSELLDKFAGTITKDAKTLSEAVTASLKGRQDFRGQDVSTLGRQNQEFVAELTKGDMVTASSILDGVAQGNSNPNSVVFERLKTELVGEVPKPEWSIILDEFPDKVDNQVNNFRGSLGQAPELLDKAKGLEAFVSSIQAMTGVLVGQFSKLEESAGALANAIHGRLRQRRSTFRGRLNDARRASDMPFRESATDNDLKVRERLNSIDQTLLSAANEDCAESSKLQSQVSALAKELESGDSSFDNETDGLGKLRNCITGDSRLALEQIKKDWLDLISQVSPGPAIPGSEPTPLDTTDLRRVISDLDRFVHDRTGQPDTSALTRLEELLSKHSDLISQLAGRLEPNRREILFDILRRARFTGAAEPVVYAFRSRARVYGWNAPPPDAKASVFDPDVFVKTGDPESEGRDRVFLDGAFKGTNEAGVIALQLAADSEASDNHSGAIASAQPTAFRVRDVVIRPRSLYGLHNDSTRVIIDGTWWTPAQHEFHRIRSTGAFCDAVVVPLAAETLDSEVPERNADSSQVQVDSVLFGLSVGRKAILEGNARIRGTPTEAIVREVAEIVDVRHTRDAVFGDEYRSTLLFKSPLTQVYDRQSLRIYANVVEATHGETQREVLGSGNGASVQKFLLKSAPLTRMPALSPIGQAMDLSVRVNGVEWQQKEGLDAQHEEPRVYTTITGADGQTTVVFAGDQARLPTGVENVQAVYRFGLGSAGNAKAGQIDQLSSPPRGVKGVRNPLPAGGGSNAELSDVAKEHARLMANGADRLVSAGDYVGFANLYADIGQASVAIFDGTIYLTVAGLEPAPLDPASRLFRTFGESLRVFGDPLQPCVISPHQLGLLFIVAKVAIGRRYEWAAVETQLRQALQERFSFGRARFGQDILLSDALETMQRVEGVVFVDAERFDSVNQSQVAELLDTQNLGNVRRRPRIEVPLGHFEMDNGARVFHAAQLCYLAPDVRGTLLLEQVP